MNILHIWDSDYPWDVRVEKINKVLIEHGDNVFLVCRNCKKWIKHEVQNDVNIFRLPFVSIGKHYINNIISFPAFFNPLWIWYTLKVAKENNIKLIIVRDLPLVLLGLYVGKKVNAPVILDMAENYPYMLESILTHSKPNIVSRIIRNPKYAYWVEKKAFARLDKIFVVIEESRNRLINMNIEVEKIDIVKNTPPKELYVNNDDVRIPDDSFYKKESNLIIIYNGLTNHSRGVLDFINIMSKIVTIANNIIFVIIGKGNDDELIHNSISKLGLQNNVYHKGWVSHHDKLRYLKHSHVGLIPYKITSHWNTTIPNKIFDYMAMKLPVLSTKINPVNRIIDETECGYVYDNESINELMEKIHKLKDKKIRHEIGMNGYNAILEKYNWEKDKKNIIDCIESYE